MSSIIFSDNQYDSSENERVCGLSKIQGEDFLLKELSRCLEFPEYFGYNWNALYDCLRDLSWIPEKGILIWHKQMPDLSIFSLQAYLHVLVDAINDWQEDNEHYLKVVFPESSVSIIENALYYV